MPDTATTATKLEQFVWADKDSLQTMKDKYNSSMSQLGEIITGIQDSVDKVEGFTGSLDAMKKDVNQVKSDMTSVKSDVEQGKKDMDTVKKGITTVKGDIEGIQGDITNINVSVKKMEDFMADPPTGSVTSEPATDIVIE